MSRSLLAVAGTLFVVNNVIFIVLMVRKFSEEQSLKEEYREKMAKISLIRSRYSSGTIQEALWKRVADTGPMYHHVHKRQIDPLVQKFITEQELILEKHCSNGTGICVRGLKGVVGPKGYQGKPGEGGLEGVHGQRGDNGTMGLNGSLGEKGLQGQKGDPGIQGLKGVLGDKGEKGSFGGQGLRGPQGGQGASGVKGVKGSRGQAGPKGEHGQKGQRGQKGAKGNKGSSGPEGPKGDKGLVGLTPSVDLNCTCMGKIKGFSTSVKNFIETDVRLNCAVKPPLTPSYSWFKNGKLLPGETRPQLIFHATSLSKAGNYVCRIRNGIEQIDRNFKVSITGLNCNFEKDLCAWRQSTHDKMDWLRHNGATASFGTGPSTDHTTGHGYYIYIETSVGSTNYNADLISPSLTIKGHHCFSFWYNMYGSNINSLTAFLQLTGGSKSTIFTAHGNQGNVWKRASINISPQTKPATIIIEAKRGTSYQGDIGVDDIAFSEGNCK